MLFDRFGRIHDYLRISLTDSCNFRCQYCMPDENMAFLPQARLMRREEIAGIAQAFVALGVRKIRLTGGEPLVRKDFGEILSDLSRLPVSLTLTTNAVLLHRFLPQLQEAGVSALNISLDSLDPDTFRRLTKRDQFRQVWDNIEQALAMGFRLKINAVAMDGMIQREILDFVALTKDRPLHVRFIEFMPFEGNGWSSGQVVPASDLLALVRERHEVERLDDEPHATARAFRAAGHAGTFAFISTMTDHFCASCNRMRLTADGKMKNCLFGAQELDLLGAYRRGEALAPLIRASVAAKHAALGGQLAPSYRETNPEQLDNRPMIRIGG
jgi:cyclic pyranopterin phosphate synthase